MLWLGEERFVTNPIDFNRLWADGPARVWGTPISAQEISDRFNQIWGEYVQVNTPLTVPFYNPVEMPVDTVPADTIATIGYAASVPLTSPGVVYPSIYTWNSGDNEPSGTQALGV